MFTRRCHGKRCKITVCVHPASKVVLNKSQNILALHILMLYETLCLDAEYPIKIHLPYLKALTTNI